jgi:hypothetical protein
MQLPAWASKLHGMYWFVRAARIQRERRKWYRRVAKERLRLVESGVDPEEVRLMCRWLANPDDDRRWRKYENQRDARVRQQRSSLKSL